MIINISIMSLSSIHNMRSSKHNLKDLQRQVYTVKARGGVRASKNRKNYYSLNQFIF